MSGVVDWANAAAGRPDVDRARTASIFRLDPAAVARQTDPRWVALANGWAEAGDLTHIGADAMAWACRFMLNDLASRYSEGELASVRKALADVMPSASPTP